MHIVFFLYLVYIPAIPWEVGNSNHYFKCVANRKTYLKTYYIPIIFDNKKA